MQPTDPLKMPALTSFERESLVEIALRSIAAGLASFEDPSHPGVDPSVLSCSAQGQAIRSPRGVFVTLEIDGALRGCVGTVLPLRPLADAVARYAYAAAFEDPRFPPLVRDELDQIDVSISILSPLEPVACRDQDELLRAFIPGRHGVVLHHGEKIATYLPAVWEKIPDPRQFLESLREKAGVEPDLPNDELRFERYEVECVVEHRHR